MIDSKGSVIVGDQGSKGGLAGVVVVPDRGRKGEDALQDPNPHATRGVTAMALQVELAFERLVHRLDQLPQRPEQPRTGPLGLALAGRSQQPHSQLGEDVFQLTAVVVLVGQQDLP
jgi:hypothetical protein